MKKFFLLIVILFISLSAFAVEVAGVPRDSNTGNTGGYDGTRVEAQLLVQVAPDTRVVHFIRDNNDPRVVTKTYLLKYVDAYEIRDYLRQIVQAKRVGNTSLVQSYPGNTSSTPAVATVSTPELNSTAAQPGYNPAAQLGSNTAVECLKYVDGTGLLIVSAEEYRFKDNPGGMGIDSIVEMLDKPELNSLGTGSQMFIYMPKFVPAVNLQSLIQNIGMNIQDATELWQGQDLVTVDNTLNWLIFDVSNYSCDNIAKLLKKYDVPVPQVTISIKVYEVYTENDERIGIDFQSWKNNEGTDFFSVGGRYRNNWAAVYGVAGNLGKTYGSERSSFYNFNPKWNTRYLDFLAVKGKADVLHSGTLTIRNNSSGTFSRTTQIFYSDSSASVVSSTGLPDMGVGPYKLLSQLIGETLKAKNPDRTDTADIPVAKGSALNVKSSSGYGFTMSISNAVVGLKECRFNVTLQNTSLIGFLSNGAPRISQGNVVQQSVSLPFSGNGYFVIGGLNKKEVTDSSTGIPWLSDIPVLGYLFSTKSKSVKNSELIVVGQCNWASPDDDPRSNMTRKYLKP
ncbi:MAG: hypothetical protein E7051_09125 [Lentisphaerae bacterium]|nr:hypothetical protein [Lentisphaerota bacterium]